MKNSLKIVAIFCMANCFQLIFYPIEALITLNWNPPDLSNDNQTTVLKQTGSNFLVVNIDKANKFNIFSSFRFIIHNFKPNLKSYNLVCLKAYQTNSDLSLHHPFICYKHPLSEYTSGC